MSEGLCVTTEIVKEQHQEVTETGCFFTDDSAMVNLFNQSVADYLGTTGNNSVSKTPPRESHH